MLKKVNRLAKDKDIKKALMRGRTFFDPYLTVKFFPIREVLRFTVVVSTKVSKKSVTRNRLKRILREHLRKNLAAFKSGDYVLILKPKACKLPEADLLIHFKEILAKINR